MSEFARLLRNQGACLVGVADLAQLPVGHHLGLPRAVAIAAAFAPEVVRGLAEHGGPTWEYVQARRALDQQLDRLRNQAIGFLLAAGHQARSATPQDLGGTDFQTLTSPLPFKTVATLAGLGWIGRCALLVTEEFGSAIRLTAVLTDAPLLTGRPVTASRCETCSTCVQVCPVQAPSGREWSPDLDRAAFFNVSACAQEVWTQAARFGDAPPIGFCGLCMAHCPWTRRYSSR